MAPGDDIDLTVDPFTQVYDRLVSILTNYAPLAALVKRRNREVFSGENPKQLGSFTPADSPGWQLRPAGGLTRVSSTGWLATQRFEFMMRSGTMRIDRQYFPLKWYCYKALYQAGRNMGIEFVSKVDLSDVTEETDDFIQSKGQQGWIGIQYIDVVISLSRERLEE